MNIVKIKHVLARRVLMPVGLALGGGLLMIATGSSAAAHEVELDANPHATIMDNVGLIAVESQPVQEQEPESVQRINIDSEIQEQSVEQETYPTDVIPEPTPELAPEPELTPIDELETVETEVIEDLLPVDDIALDSEGIFPQEMIDEESVISSPTQEKDKFSIVSNISTTPDSDDLVSDIVVIGETEEEKVSLPSDTSSELEASQTVRSLLLENRVQEAKDYSAETSAEKTVPALKTIAVVTPAKAEVAPEPPLKPSGSPGAPDSPTALPAPSTGSGSTATGNGSGTIGSPSAYLHSSDESVQFVLLFVTQQDGWTVPGGPASQPGISPD